VFGENVAKIVGATSSWGFCVYNLLPLNICRHRRGVWAAAGEHIRSRFHRGVQAASTFWLDGSRRGVRVTQTLGQPQQEPRTQRLPALLLHRTTQETAGTTL